MISDAVKGFMEGAVKPILDKFIPDAQQRLEAENLIYTQAHAISLGQIEVNKIEAQSDKLFVAGWRPFIGWVCGASFAYAVIGNDVLNWVLQLASNMGGLGHKLPDLPEPDVTLTFEILMALLGMGGLRTYEKMKGVHRR